MGRIIGIDAGLNPTNTQACENAIAERKRIKKAKLETAPDSSKLKFNTHPVGEIICDCCGGQVGFATVKKKLDSTCAHCKLFFGLGVVSGCTNKNPDQARKIIHEAKEFGWVMILRRFHCAAANGDRCEVDAGDIFRVQRAGSNKTDELDPCSKERTWNMFTLSVMIGPHELTQFPHEISPMSFVHVMDLQAKKQVEMVYVSKDDEYGHFTPLPELRSQIYQTFGALVNA